MPQAIKAAVCRDFGHDLSIETIYLQSPQYGEVQVQLAACAICHSDILFAAGAWGGKLPAVYGHEAAGVVTAIGAGVDKIQPGDHVVVTLIRACGHCHYCAQGLAVICETEFALDQYSPLSSSNTESLSQGMRTGAFAEAVVVHHSQVVVIPKSVPLDSASLLACGVITGFGAVTNTAKVKPGSNVVVIGTGGVGLNCVQAAALSGARSIIAIDIAKAKLQAALSFGASHSLDGREPDLIQQVQAITAGRGADYVLVSVGVKSAFEQAFNLLARAGTLVLVGMPPNGIMTELDPGTVASLNQRVLGSKMGTAQIQIDVPYLVSLYQQGRLKLDELISGRYSLDQINTAIKAVSQPDVLRNVIMF